MTLYYVDGQEFTNLASAKAEMKATGKKGFKVKIYSNGDWIPCGEITLKGSNRCKVVGAHNTNQY